VFQSAGPAFPGNWTAFAAKLDGDGKRIWGTYYGSGNSSVGYCSAVASDDEGNVFVCGGTIATSGISTCDAFQTVSGGNQDMFVAMLGVSAKAAIPSLRIAGSQALPACAGERLDFTALVSNAPANIIYQWTINSTNAGSNAAIFSSSRLQNNDTIRCLASINTGCRILTALSDPITIKISAPVTPAITISTDKTGSSCTGQPVGFTAHVVNGGNVPVYQWLVNGLPAGTNDSSFIYDRLRNGDIVRCQLFNPRSCSAVTTTLSNDITVAVKPDMYPAVAIKTSADTICKGDPVIFTATAINAASGSTVEWWMNGVLAGNGFSFSTTALLATDTVMCKLITPSDACATGGGVLSEKRILAVNPVPVIAVHPNNPAIFPGDTVQLHASSTGPVQYRWTPASYISNDLLADPLVWPATTQVYRVELVTDKGCRTNASVTVSVITGIRIPNAFTPNHDGLNDVWRIKGLELYKNCRVSIFNRLGQLVFQSGGYAVPWDGTTRNQLLSTGSYAYVIDLKNGTKPLTGTLNLIR
jgi:large repetitive protein